MTTYDHYRPGFAQYAKPRQRTRKSRLGFDPTEQQVLGMVGCLTGWLKKQRGVHYTEVSDHVLAKELLRNRQIHCRGNRFGRTREEIQTTICAALKRMTQDGSIRRETDPSDRHVIMLREWHEGRKHQDRYRNASRRTR